MSAHVGNLSKPAASESVLTALYLNVGLEKGVLMRVAVDLLAGEIVNYVLEAYAPSIIRTYIHNRGLLRRISPCK